MQYQSDGPANAIKRSKLLFLHASGLKIFLIICKSFLLRIMLTIATLPRVQISLLLLFMTLL